MPNIRPQQTYNTSNPVVTATVIMIMSFMLLTFQLSHFILYRVFFNPPPPPPHPSTKTTTKKIPLYAAICC